MTRVELEALVERVTDTLLDEPITDAEVMAVLGVVVSEALCSVADPHRAVLAWIATLLRGLDPVLTPQDDVMAFAAPKPAERRH